MPAAVAASAQVAVPVAQARRWFLELQSHPERYRFDTHAGFEFVRGSFGEVGARFQTREKFWGIGLSLQFELVQIEATRFRFRLLRPPLPVECAFLLQERDGGTTELRLKVVGTRWTSRLVLRLPGIYHAVQRQIQREVDHIGASMEKVG
ncbi:MAG: hypothetical protein JW900_00485 [Anaerolineae bacterium]|nr:hypothetical protein [Anaerolineae bacterium]